MPRVGLISDTHGLLRPEATAFLRGSDFIVHGGDIGHPSILEQLGALAPVTAVRGNNDKGSWAESLRETELLQASEVFVYAIHDLSRLDIEPIAAGVHVVVSGHSHKPLVQVRNGVLYVNPGSSGPRRFTLPIAVGELIVTGSSVSARIVELVSQNEGGRGSVTKVLADVGYALNEARGSGCMVALTDVRSDSDDPRQLSLR